MKKNILLLFVVFTVFLSPTTTEAFSATSVETLTADILYNKNIGSIFSGFSFIKYGITKPEISVTYNARVVRTDTNQLLTNGESVPAGITLNFIPEPFRSVDAYYRDTSSLGGSVNAQWTNNAAFPSASLARQSSSSCLAGDYLHSRTTESTFTLGPFMCILGGRLGSGCSAGTTFKTTNYIDDYPPFSIHPPSVSIQHSGTAGLSCTNNNSICVITSSGTINSNFVFSQTSGKFYYMYQTTTQQAVPGLCTVSSTSQLNSGSIGFSLLGGSPYTHSVPQTSINVSLTATTGSQCADGIDNDGDGYTDYPADSSCSGYGGTSEGVYTPPPPIPETTQCSDGIDNNGNGFVDYPDDPACVSELDDNEEVLPSADISLIANPRLLIPDTSISLIWTTDNVENGSCSLTGSNGDSWDLSGNGGTKTSSPIDHKTTFTLTCTDLEGDTTSESVTVITVPRFQEI